MTTESIHVHFCIRRETLQRLDSYLIRKYGSTRRIRSASVESWIKEALEREESREKIRQKYL